MNVTKTVCEEVPFKKCLRWSAVFAGALVALGLGFLLQLFGLAIGLTAYHSEAGSSSIAIGGVLGIIVAVIVSMGIAGFVAGYYGKFYKFHQGESFVYGFLTWSIALLLSAVLLLPLTQYMSSYKERLHPEVTVSNNLQHNSVVETSHKNPQTQATETEVMMTPAMLKGSFWLLFILFFIGAISSCIGANLGMNCELRCRSETTVL